MPRLLLPVNPSIFGLVASAATLLHHAANADPAIPTDRVKTSSKTLAFTAALGGSAARAVLSFPVANLPVRLLGASPAVLHLMPADRADGALVWMIFAYTFYIAIDTKKLNLIPAQIGNFYLQDLFRTLRLYLIFIPIASIENLVIFANTEPLAHSRSILPSDHDPGLGLSFWSLSVELLFPLLVLSCKTFWNGLFSLDTCACTELVTSASIAEENLIWILERA